jgi:hypothetical protein
VSGGRTGERGSGSENAPSQPLVPLPLTTARAPSTSLVDETDAAQAVMLIPFIILAIITPQGLAFRAIVALIHWL